MIQFQSDVSQSLIVQGSVVPDIWMAECLKLAKQQKKKPLIFTFMKEKRKRYKVLYFFSLHRSGLCRETVKFTRICVWNACIPPQKARVSRGGELTLPPMCLCSLPTYIVWHLEIQKKKVNLRALHHPHDQKSCVKVVCPGLENVKLMQVHQPVLPQNGMEEDVKQKLSLSEGRGAMRLLLQVLGKG